MDSDPAWVNGKSGSQSWRYADAFQRSIISEAIYHLPFMSMVLRLRQHNIGYTADGLQVWWRNQQCQSTEGGWLSSRQASA